MFCKFSTISTYKLKENLSNYFLSLKVLINNINGRWYNVNSGSLNYTLRLFFTYLVQAIATEKSYRTRKWDSIKALHGYRYHWSVLTLSTILLRIRNVFLRLSFKSVGAKSFLLLNSRFKCVQWRGKRKSGSGEMIKLIISAKRVILLMSVL